MRIHLSRVGKGNQLLVALLQRSSMSLNLNLCMPLSACLGGLSVGLALSLSRARSLSLALHVTLCAQNFNIGMIRFQNPYDQIPEPEAPSISHHEPYIHF